MSLIDVNRTWTLAQEKERTLGDDERSLWRNDLHDELAERPAWSMWHIISHFAHFQHQEEKKKMFLFSATKHRSVIFYLAEMNE